MTGLLSGLRVLDLSGITAGGRTTQILGDFGADVIKLEGPRRPDPFRHWTAVTGSTGLGDLGNPAFRVVNRNKRGLAIDLKRPESRAIVQRLVERSDIVVENFRREVMDRLGLSYATLREWNPAVVLLSLSSQGGTGPERFNVSFGSTLEALGGLMAMTGYDRDTPTWSTNKVNYPDQTVSILAPALAAWGHLRSEETGVGCWIDLSQREAVTSLLGEWVAASSVTGASPGPTANRGLHDSDFCLPCSGDDEWVTVSLPDDGARRAVAALVGAAALPADYAAIEGLLTTWTAKRSGSEATAELTVAGATAAPVLRAVEVIDELGPSFYTDVDLPDNGSEKHIAWPVDIEPAGQPSIRLRPPHVGEHTREILGELSFSPTEIDDLFAAGVVSDRVVT